MCIQQGGGWKSYEEEEEEGKGKGEGEQSVNEGKGVSRVSRSVSGKPPPQG